MNFLEKISYLCKSKDSTKLAVKADDMTDLLLAVLSDYGTACVSLAYYAKKLGYEYPETVDIGGWLKMPILVLKPTLGDIVVFGKDKPTKVGIFLSKDINFVYFIEVNNGIVLTAHPAERVLGYRKLYKINTDEN